MSQNTHHNCRLAIRETVDSVNRQLYRNLKLTNLLNKTYSLEDVMLLKKIFAMTVMVFVIGTSRMMAQTHFVPPAPTGSNMTVAIQSSVNPNIAGVPLVSGDEIGAFSPGGLCVGAVQWTGANTALTVWGDNSMTVPIDGMQGGEVVSYRFWKQATNLEYAQVTAVYAVGTGAYANGNMDILSSLTATNVPLPVELTSFTATSLKSKVMLQWKTATEVNNYGFQVERRQVSAESKWTSVGFVNGSGTTNVEHQYSYTDAGVSAGRYLYRLKQINNDGSFKYIQDAEVEVGNMAQNFMLGQNYPNPFNPSTNIAFDIPVSAQVKIDVYNILGEQVASLFNGMKTAGHHTITFEASNFATGIYYYKMTAGDYVDIKKMILMK